MTELGLRFLRRPGPGGRAANLAAFGATAVVSLLVTFLIAGTLGLTHRSDRIGWRTTNNSDRSTAVAAINEIPDMVAAKPVARYDVAVLKPTDTAPPGLDHAPRPGEVYVSPALAKYWTDLAKRYGVEQPTGTITESGLSSPDELVVIRGVQATGLEDPKYLEGWNKSSTDERMATLLVLVAFGIALVLFPLLSLVGQAAGVAAKRREHRLAALRLAGATRSQVLWLSTVEQTVLGFIGAVAGLIAYTALSPIIARIPLGGGTWYLHDLTVNWWTVLVVLIAVPTLSAISALIGLGRVSITPLGVVRGQTRKGMSALRLLLLVIGPILLVVFASRGALVPLVIAIGLAALAIRVVGPWLVQVLGKLIARAANGPVFLLAGRRLADDPKAAFRPVAALVLSGFVTGFLALFMPYGLGDETADTAFELRTDRARTVVVAQDARKKLADAGLKGEVTTKHQSVLITVQSGDRERVRTVLYDVAPGQVPLTEAERSADDAALYSDMRLGVALLLGLVFVTAGASTAAGAVGTALDQVGPARALRRSGIPLAVVEKAARVAALVPVVGVGLPVIGFGAFCGLLLSQGQVVTEGPSGVVLLVAQLGAGLLLVAGAAAAGSPILRAASSN